MISFLKCVHETLYTSRVYSQDIMIPKRTCFHTIIPAAFDHIWVEKEVFSVCVLLFYLNWYPPEHFSRPQSLGPYFDRKKYWKTENVSLIFQKRNLEQLLAFLFH